MQQPLPPPSKSATLHPARLVRHVLLKQQRLSRRYENYDDARGTSEDAMARDWAREEAKAGSVTQLVESLRERFPNLQLGLDRINAIYRDGTQPAN